jgi:hypothetical protein
MTKELIKIVRGIHRLERSIRVLELVRDRTQQLVDETIAGNEKQGTPTETNFTVAKARSNIAAYNRAILGAKALVRELERGGLEL